MSDLKTELLIKHTGLNPMAEPMDRSMRLYFERSLAAMEEYVQIYRQMLANDAPASDNGLHLQRVSQRSELLAIEALKKITKTHEETWSKQIATEALQAIANCG